MRLERIEPLPRRCQTKPLSDRFIEAEDDKDSPKELHRRGLCRREPGRQSATERSHQAPRLQQDQAPDNVGRPDDQHCSRDGQVPARGRQPVSVGCVIEEHAGGCDGLTQQEQLGPGCRSLKDRQGACGGCEQP